MPTPKENFINGWTTYVKPVLSFPPTQPPADYYWDPRLGNWYTYPASLNRIEDKGWPKTDLSSFLANAGTTFDQIMAQYRAIAGSLQPEACWDPRIGKWMSVTRQADGKTKALTELLQEVGEIHRKGYLSTYSTNQIQTAILREM